MRIFVTGGDGFIGRHLLPALVRAGHEVTALAGEPHSPRVLQQLGARTIIPGRLETPEAWLPTLAGHDAIIHLAAPVRVWGPWALFQQQMVQATQHLFQGAARYRVPRFVYTSSETVHWGWDVAALVDIDERAAFSQRPFSHYSRAKQQVERFLQRAVGPTQPVIVRLPFVWGPGTPFLAELERQVRQGTFVWIGNPDIPIEAIHVENAVTALQAALLQGKPAATYFVTDAHPHTLRSFLGGIIEALGLPMPGRHLPASVLRGWLRIAEAIWRALRLPSKPFPMTCFELAFFTLPRRYRLDRARHDWGYTPVRSWPEGLTTLQG